MKTGIMSMQRVANYGSFLQAYSLKRTLEGLGHEVEFVDYRVEAPLVSAPVSSGALRGRIQGKLLRMKMDHKRNRLPALYDSFTEFHARYQNEYLPLLGVGQERNERPKRDALIIGSDEVFNCLQTAPTVGYSRELFGKDANASKVLSYAASFGNTTLEGLKKYGIAREVGNLLAQFSSISIRDVNSLEIVETLTGRIPEKNVDPVFLYDYAEELEKNPSRFPWKDYLVVYAYNNRILPEEGKKIRAFAKKRHLKVVSLAGDQDFCDVSVYPNPFEMLNILRNAKYVFTDTFHGSVFSIKYNRPFGVFVRRGQEQIYGNSQKLLDLLNLFGLENRSITAGSDFDQILEESIDWSRINTLIDKEQSRSQKYLKKGLSEWGNVV